MYGAELFNWLFQGQIRSMYDRLPESSVSVQLTSNWHELKRVPWEYLSAPNTPAPSRQRSVVRVLPGLSAATQLSAPRRKRLKVLFVTANPIDQQGVSKLQRLRSVILAANSANIAVEGYGQQGVRKKTIEMSALRQSIADAIVVDKGPWTTPGVDDMSTQEKIVVTINDDEGQVHQWELIGGDILVFDPGPRYLVVLRDQSLEAILLDACGEPSRREQSKLLSEQMRRSK